MRTNFFFSTVRGPSWLQPHINRDPRNRINLLHVPPPVEGGFRGGGGGHAGRDELAVWFNDERYTLSAIFWFWIPRSQVELGTYESQPILNLTGDLRASTEGRSLFEEPVLTWDMELWQEIDFGEAAPVSQRLWPFTMVHLHRRSNVTEHISYSRSGYVFPMIRFLVQEPAAIVITLHVEMKFWRDAYGHFWFHPAESEEFFRVDMPTWRLGFTPLSDLV